MKKLVVFCLFFIMHSCSSYYHNATTYYVDESNGNDTNDGISQQTAWRTIQKVNSVKFSPGDSVLFKKGETWREKKLSPKASGIEGNPIVFSSYGIGKKPRLLGSDNAKSWDRYRGQNIWYTTYYFPDFIKSPGVFFEKESTSYWGLKKDSLDKLKHPFEWFIENNKLFIYSPKNPSEFYSSVECVKRWSGIRVKKYQHILFENFEIAYYGEVGVRIENKANFITIKDCIIHHNGVGFDKSGEGIYWLASFGLIANNNIYENGVHGIYIGAYGQNKAVNNIVEHNRIWNHYHTGIDIMNVNSVLSDIVVRFNVVYDSLPEGRFSGKVEHGIQTLGQSINGREHIVNNVKIYGNIIYNMTDRELNLQGFSDSIFVYNNTIISSKVAGVLIFDDGNQNVPQHLFFTNNICVSKDNKVIKIVNPDNKVFDYNLYFTENPNGIFGKCKSKYYKNLIVWQEDTGFDYHSVYANPEFSDFSMNNYSPKKNSPAINRGIDLGKEYARSLNGKIRTKGSNWNIGAIEK